MNQKKYNQVIICLSNILLHSNPASITLTKKLKCLIKPINIKSIKKKFVLLKLRKISRHFRRKISKHISSVRRWYQKQTVQSVCLAIVVHSSNLKVNFELFKFKNFKNYLILKYKFIIVTLTLPLTEIHLLRRWGHCVFAPFSHFSCLLIALIKNAMMKE